MPDAAPSRASPAPATAAAVFSRLLQAPAGVWIAVILIAAFAVYWPALHGAFLWDDDGHLTKPELRSTAGLARIWFEVGATQQYYPVLHSAFWLQHRFFGDAPLPYHVVNVLLHATAACLFATVLHRLRVPGGWLAALLFVLHPVCVESVAWISEQKNTLSLTFYLCAALAYLRFERTRAARDYAGASLLFILALGAKTVTASLPAALLVVGWWQRGRLEWRRDVVPLLPWFAFAVAAGLGTAWVEHTLINRSYEYELGPLQRVLLAGRVIWFYLGKLLLPFDLIFVYPRWTVDAGVWWQYLFPAGVVLALFAAWRWRQHRGPVAAGLLFAGTLFPALGFVNVYPFVFSYVADHFQYHATLGILALAGAGMAHALASRYTVPAAAALLAVLVMYGALARGHSATFRDNLTLYQTTLAKNPNAALAHHNLANELIDLGRADEAMPHLQAAVALWPDSVKANYNFARALLARREVSAAIPLLERTIRLDPRHGYAQNDLGFVLMNAGQLDAAEPLLREAVRLVPDYATIHFNLAVLLTRRGDHAQAITSFAEATRLQPDKAEFELSYAVSLLALERVGEALAHFERAGRLAPDRPEIQQRVAGARAMGARLEAAIAQLRATVAREPNSAQAHFELGLALRQLGRTEEAAPHLAEAAKRGLVR